MLKRILAVAIAVVLVMSMAVVAVSAADTDSASAGAEVSNSAGAEVSNSGTGAGNKIYFDAGKWNNYSLIYCHIWERGGDPFFSWQSKAEGCKKESGTLFSYDLSKLDASTTISGGLQPGKDYCVIFSANTGVQTFDQTFGTACIGDTARVTGKMIENAVDSEKKAYEAVWKTNSAKYGPHLALSSTGKIIGSVLCPNEKGEEVIGDWLPNYCNHDITYNVDVVKCLKDALLKFNVKDIEGIYAYILSKETPPSKDDQKKMLGQLQDAYKLAYPNDKEGAKIDPEKVKRRAEDIKKNPGAPISGGPSGGSTNSSGSGSDGQADTLFIILGAVMVLAAGTMIFARKKREE